LDMVGLLSVSNKKIKHFSFGMKQRLSLAMCLIIEPKLAIMDEPFVGLDPNGVQSLILSLKKWVKIKNTSLLISSHQLNELEAVCDRFVFLKEGQLHEIQLDEFQFLKIIVDKEIENEHILLFKREFPIISKIEKNVIYIPNDARHYNALLKFVLSHYNLVHIDTPKQGLYSAFDYFERNEE
ncbi:TPA: ATP-binding cassette domain-containing protein, partial [Staphylococcus pseudintermedius]|nr:ATP-binding cassette domain-containing protein [Staphylococcus pseudintermedius]HCT0402120.1 ATP-binding cassette domain-containing protein [Staphylococcus pseudintermedius]HDT8722261.1 ATP-binding cassette domain-containing protein [Staphylococcus pseudintermedius]